MALQFKEPQEQSAEPTIRVRQCPGVSVRELVASMILVLACVLPTGPRAVCVRVGVENQSSPPAAHLILRLLGNAGSGPGPGSQISGLGRADG